MLKKVSKVHRGPLCGVRWHKLIVGLEIQTSGNRFKPV